MSEVAIIVWAVIAMVVVGLFVWRWIGVHSKTEDEQAAAAILAASGELERLAETRAPTPEGMPPPDHNLG